MNASEHPRQRIRPLFMLLMAELREQHGGLLNAVTIRLIREFGTACYERAYEDIMNRTTLPAPKYAEHDAVTGSYPLVQPARKDAR